ncbi:TetR/AcrR family transcriptional regulator [Dehalococcoidia bacterium]|nr:TetR/AcrR family transcriptional regulator [Dehalococcoidia bacterium]
MNFVDPASGVDKSATRERILDAAAEVFATKGYHSSVVDDIVHDSNTSKGAVYFHFPSKQEIFLALVSRLADTLLGSTQDAITEEQEGLAKFDAALGTVFESLSQHRSLAKILLVSGAGLGRPFDEHLFNLLDRFAEMIKDNLDEAITAGSIQQMDTSVVAYAWLGAVHEIVTRWLYTGEPDPLESAVPTLRALLLGSVGLPIGTDGH